MDFNPLFSVGNADVPCTSYEEALRYYREKATDGDNAATERLRELLLVPKGFIIFGGTLVRYTGKNVKELALPSCVTAIGDGAFADAELDTLSIHEGVNVIAEGAFGSKEPPNVITSSSDVEKKIAAIRKEREKEAKERDKKRERAAAEIEKIERAAAELEKKNLKKAVKAAATDAEKSPFVPAIPGIAVGLGLLILYVMSGGMQMIFAKPFLFSLLGIFVAAGSVTVTFTSCSEATPMNRFYRILNLAVALASVGVMLFSGRINGDIGIGVIVVGAVILVISVCGGVAEGVLSIRTPAAVALTLSAVAVAVAVCPILLGYGALHLYKFPSVLFFVAFAICAVAAAVCCFACCRMSREKDNRCGVGAMLLVAVVGASLYGALFGGFVEEAVLKKLVYAVVIAALVAYCTTTNGGWKLLRTAGFLIGFSMVGLFTFVTVAYIEEGNYEPIFLTVFDMMTLLGASIAAAFGFFGKKSIFSGSGWICTVIVAYCVYATSRLKETKWWISLIGFVAALIFIFAVIVNGVKRGSLSRFLPLVFSIAVISVFAFELYVAREDGVLIPSYPSQLFVVIYGALALVSAFLCIVSGIKCCMGEVSACSGEMVCIVYVTLGVFGILFGGILPFVANAIIVALFALIMYIGHKYFSHKLISI